MAILEPVAIEPETKIVTPMLKVFNAIESFFTTAFRDIVKLFDSLSQIKIPIPTTWKAVGVEKFRNGVRKAGIIKGFSKRCRLRLQK